MKGTYMENPRRICSRGRLNLVSMTIRGSVRPSSPPRKRTAATWRSTLTKTGLLVMILRKAPLFPMPSKSIFRQPGAKHFQLVHRSQRDPLIHDPEASKHVLRPFIRENAKKVRCYLYLWTRTIGLNPSRENLAPILRPCYHPLN